MPTMRRVLELALLMPAALWLMAGAAVAATDTTSSDQVQSVTVRHTATGAGQATVVEIEASLFKTDGTKASPPVGLDIRFPNGMARNASSLPTCHRNILLARGLLACPGAKVGVGLMTFDVRPIVDFPLAGDVTVFNGPSGSILLYVIPELGAPFVIEGNPLPGPAIAFRFTIPPIPTLPDQPNATISKITFDLGLGDLWTNPPTPCSAGWTYGFDFTYQNGDQLSLPEPLNCTPFNLRLSFLTLTQDNSTTIIGSPHCVTGTVDYASGSPIPNVTVYFFVDGSNFAFGPMRTLSSGQARFCYTGQNTGEDSIYAFADTDGDGGEDANEPYDLLFNTYTVETQAPSPPASSSSFVPQKRGAAKKPTCTVPKVRGLSLTRAKKKLSRAGCRYRARGKGRVTSTVPAAGKETTARVVVKAKPKRHRSKGKRQQAKSR